MGAWGLAACWLALATGARAQLSERDTDNRARFATAPARVLVLGPTASEDPARFTEVVRGLRSAGLHAVQVSELPIDPVFAACRSPDCAVRVAQVAHMPVLLCTLASHRASVELQWYGPDGTQIALSGARANATWADVIATLAQRLRRKLLLGERALLRVQSVPVSALVKLDGQLAGVTPFEQPWPAGSHELRVELSGRQADVRRIVLEGAELLTVAVKLPRDLAAESSTPREAASPLNYAAGGALALVSMPLLITAVTRLANQGQCLASEAGVCTQRGEFGALGTGLLIGGIAALGGGAFILIGQPFRVDVAVEHSAVSLQASGRF